MILRVTGANQNARKLLFTDLVNTNRIYYCGYTINFFGRICNDAEIPTGAFQYAVR